MKLSRRQFIGGTAAAAAGAALFNFNLLTKSVTAADDSLEEMKTFRNVCPRNCYDTCGQISYVQNGILKKVEGDPKHGYTNGKLCLKGYTYTRRVYSPDRVKYPMKQTPRGSGNWTRISWDEAMDTIAKKILELKSRYGSTLPICFNKYSGNFGIVHYGAEGTMSSIGYTTRALGTPCWPAGIDAQTYDFGTLYSNDPEDMVNTKYLILWGQNAAWTAIHSLPFINKARERGAKLVVIDPVLTSTASKADLYIQINSSTDGALALGMARHILDNNWVDWDYARNNSVGFDEWVDYLKTNITLDWASEKTGVPQDIIKEIAREYATTKPASMWVGYGMQRHINGGQNVRIIDALGVMTGNVGKSGGGVNYGHLETWGFNYNAMVNPAPKGSKGFIGSDGKEGDRNINMNNFAHDVMAQNDPPVKMLWLACRNPGSQDPDTNAIEKMFAAMEFVVTVDSFFNKTVQMSDIVLPATTHFEDWDVMASYWHYWIGINQRAIDPLYESKSDVEIAMLLSEKMNALDPGSCTFPTSGTPEEWVAKEFNPSIHSLLGISDYQELIEGPRKAKMTPASWADGKFRTPSNKIEIHSNLAEKNGLPALPIWVEDMKAPEKYPIRLFTPHPQHGLHSQFQNLDWMMAANPEPKVEIHPVLAAKYGISEGDKVKIYNDLGSIIVKAHLTRTTSPEVIVSYEAWYKDSNFNVNYTLKATPSDMGKQATGNNGVAFHDNFVTIEKA
ncbi:molybdopterin-dependent oxidoreductase [Desulfosporosinus meridiei]|uniref:Anaerobic dehydrogenase, typically selenocysteine-containing n=1 Tax=Desulfosporosinus meridiei (strain ATCC BAA-275 / DSM 13257 / KCTC 12902 / NCIMB 13706 / S10) TaxID=768704 RepID=J7IWX0_DESMD|nr:molybdopterin-dependent oxidoreductase [Desulfosporosinus meridiei]AFQ46230.1 anaerobic dehydrogenase, typically selenocysteine-containing [Desulfosporosinus meridiei DSM 13257]